MRRVLGNTIGRLTAPLLVAVLVAGGLALQGPPADVAAAQPVATAIGQTHYLPWDAQQFYDILIGQQATGTDAIDSPVRLITSFVSAVDGNTVAIDHWEDGYDVDPIGAPGASTEIFSLDEGDPQLLDNLVDLGSIGDISQGYYDGGDKLVSTGAIVVNMGGWPSNATTLHAGAVVVREVNSYGYEFVSPVGEDSTYGGTESALATLWEYVGLLIVASQDDTTVTLDDGTEVTLDEGDSHLVNGGVGLGDTVTADKPIGVFLATGDNGASYEGRLFGLLPTEAWFDGYITPVGSRNQTDQATRVFLYNPGASSITVDWESSGGTTGTVSVPAGGQGNVRLPTNQGMRLTSPGNPFYALQAVTTPENGATDRSSAYNWGLALTPSRALTPMVVIGYGPGSENFTENDSPVWVAAQGDTTVLVDLDADPATGALIDGDGNHYDFSCAVTELTPVLIKDIGGTSCSTISGFTNSTNAAGDADMTGARIYSDDGTSIVAAWGQVPGLNSVQPAIDMGTAVLPFPVIDLQKDAEIVGDDGDGLALPGDTIHYTIQAINRGIAPIDDLTLTDELPPNVAYVPGTTVADGNPVADDPTGTPFPLDDGILLPPAIDVGQTRVVTFDVVVDDPLPTDVTEFVNVATLATDYGTYSDIATTPTTPTGSIGDRVWDDADGDGVQDGPETGMVGVTVELVDGNGDVIDTTTTGTDGAYTFGDLYPGPYTVRVDPTSLPAGRGATFDLDGTGTAHEAALTLAAGEDRTDADFGYATSTITLAKTVYEGHDGGSGCPGGELATGESGDDITYCFQVTNTGAIALLGVGVDDPDLGIDESDMSLESGNPATLLAGQSVVWSYNAQIDGDLVNTAEAEAFISLGGARRTATDTAEVDEIGPSIGIEKTVYRGHDGGASCGTGVESLQVRTGGDLTYCFVVTNTGETNLAAVDVTDPDLGLGSGDLTHALLTPGQSVTLHAEAQADGDLLNTASVVGTSPAGAQPTDSDTAEVDQIDPALTVDKTIYAGHDGGASCAGAESVTALDGDPVTWCFAITNTGDVTLTDLTVDDLPLLADETDLTVLSGSLASVAPGDTVNLYLEASATGDLTNTATATGVPPVGPDVTDDDTASLDVVDPGLALAKAVYLGHDGGAGCAGAGSSVTGEPGQPVTWCFTVTNTGDTPLADVVLDDADLGVDQTDLDVLSGSLATLAPGSSVVLYLEGAIDGDLVNTATASASPPAGPDLTDEDDAAVEEVVPGYTLSKTVYRGHDGGTSCEGGESVLGRPGDPVTWCFLVTNTGETDLDVTVTDPDVGLDRTITDLAPGADETLYVEGVVDGDLVNTATGSGVPPYGPPIPHEDEAEVDEIHPALTVDKTIYAGHDSGASCAGTESVTTLDGDPVTWCFAVTNTGDVTLTDLTVDDLPLLADETDLTVLSGSLASVAPGDTVTLYLEASATGDVANTATATGVPPVGPDVTDDDTASLEVIAPSITLEKTVYAGHDSGAGCDGGELVTGLPGDDVTYCFTVTNATGEGPLTNVQLADLDLDDSGITLLSGDVTPLADGQSATFYLEASIAGDLVNTGSVTATPLAGPDVSDEDTAEVDEVNADIALVKSVYLGHSSGADCATAASSVADERGRPVTWCFTVTNTGDATLTDVQVDDVDLGVDQSGLTVLSGSPASLAPGDSVVLYLEGTIDGDLTNTATASATPPVGPDPSDEDTANVDELIPSYTIDKTVYRGHDGGTSCAGQERVIARSGDPVTWCIEVVNTGDTVLDVHVTDPDVGLDDNVDDLAPGDSAVLFVEGTVDGDLVNTASGTGVPPHGPPIPEEDDAEVDEVHPALTIDKTVYGGHDAGAGCDGAESYADEAGQPVTWCFTVTNTGDTDLTDVTVDDADLGVDQADLTVLSGSLALIPAGEDVTLYLEGTLDADLTNTATATGTPPVGQDVSDEDDASVEVLVPGLTIDKTVYAGHDGGASCEGEDRVVARSGAEVTWCFLVTNTAELTLDVAVDDPDVGFTGTVDDLAPGDSATLWFEGTVDGDLLNTATATGDTPEGDEVTDEDSAEIDEIDPTIQVDKTVYLGHDSGVGCAGGESVEAEVDAEVTWCFAITNTGDVDLVDIDLADPVLGIDQGDVTVLSGDLSSLEPDDTVSVYVEGTVDGDIANTVTVGGVAPDDSRVTDEDTAGVTVVAPQIGVAKTVVEGPTGNGDGTYTLTYRIRVANAGETRLDAVQVTDDLSETFAGVRSFRVDDVVSADLTVNPAYDGRPSGSIELLAGTDVLEFGQRGDIEVTVTVDPGANLGPYENLALATGTSPGGHDVDDASDSGTDADPTAPNPDEPGDTGGTDDPVPVEFPPIDLTVVKTAADVRVDGSLAIIDWRMVVTNEGPGDDPGPITVTDELDERLTFVSATGEGWGCEVAARLVTCVWDAPLAAGDSTTEIQLLTEMTVTADAEVTNGAHVSSTGAESRTDNNDDAAAVDADVDEATPTGTLPRTGAAVGTLVLLGLGLVFGGRLLQRRGRGAGSVA